MGIDVIRSEKGILVDHLKRQDEKVFAAIEAELGRQRSKIELIASENFVSEAVMEAQGSVLTNKYAEGYPGKRYYGGCEHVDVVEDIARDRVKEIFGAEHVNVQPLWCTSEHGSILHDFRARRYSTWYELISWWSLNTRKPC